jgi:N-acyl homoserine lactone hydrolase
MSRQIFCSGSPRCPGGSGGAKLAISALATSAQTRSGVDRLYIINCGEGVAGDISRWSPGVNVGKSMDFVDII